MTIHTVDISHWIAPLIANLAARSAEIVEILSDVSTEHYLNAVTARSLRAYGRSHLGPRFWVRSEWGKTDISYGYARRTKFTCWDKSWQDGDTGDLGQLEAKLIYTHFTTSQREERLAKLANQLEQRRASDTNLRGRAHADAQCYHGLVWVFDHGSDNKVSPPPNEDPMDRCQRAIAERAASLGLTAAWRSPVPFQPVLEANLGDFWPTVEGSYVGRLSLAVFRLSEPPVG